MTANTSEIFPASYLAWTAQLDAANTNRDGSGTVVTVVAAPDNCARIERIHVKAQGTTRAGAVRFYLDDDGDSRLLHEMPVGAHTISGATPTFEHDWVREDGQPLVLLGPDQSLVASTHVADTFDVVAYGSLY